MSMKLIYVSSSTPQYDTRLFLDLGYLSCKDWRLKIQTKVYSRFLIEKILEFLLFFYLHFL